MTNTNETTKSTAALNNIGVGDYVVAGWDQANSDMGEILSVSDCGEYAVVAWSLAMRDGTVRLDWSGTTFWKDKGAARAKLDALRHVDVYCEWHSHGSDRERFCAD